jgi:hypothetical protein
MFLKEVVSCINRTLWGQFLREICSPKKCTPKIGAVNGTITGILLKIHNLSSHAVRSVIGGAALDKLHELQATIHHKSLSLMLINCYDWG